MWAMLFRQEHWLLVKFTQAALSLLQTCPIWLGLVTNLAMTFLAFRVTAFAVGIIDSAAVHRANGCSDGCSHGGHGVR